MKSHLNSIKQAVLVFLSTGLLSGCTDNLLDTTAYEAVNSEKMWTTEELTDLGVAGIYQAMRAEIDKEGSGRAPYEYDRLGIGLQSRGFNWRGVDRLLQGSATSGDGLFEAVFKDAYVGIFRCNDAIAHIPVKSPVDETKKGRLIAEAKILRALFYMKLNQLYGGVPLYLEPTALDEMIKARSTEAEVWQAIEKDLTEAIDEPALPGKYAAGNQLYGHVTKGTAYALRGKVYLYLEEYEKAIADFEQVEKSGYALYQGEYKTLFKEENEQSDEMILSIQNIDEPGYGMATPWALGTRNVKQQGWSTYIATSQIVELHEYTDGSRFDWEEVIPGYNALSPEAREVFFLRDNLTDAEKTAAEERGADMSLYLPEGNEARIKRAFENRDPRLAANIMTPYSTYTGVWQSVDQDFTLRWPYRSDNPDQGADLRIDGNKFYYVIRKFVSEGNNENTSRTTYPVDFPLIRYADVLLMWAEALAEKDGLSEKAIELLNRVRERAGVALLNSSDATRVTGREDLIERIRNERRIELFLEGVNYFDELRWGTWIDQVFNKEKALQYPWGAIVSNYVLSGDYIQKWPIPQGEIDRNPNLEQNPGWIN